MRRCRKVLGFTVLLSMLIITIISCNADTDNSISFPSSFLGKWKRDNSVITLTFTTNTLKASNQGEVLWYLTKVSGDTYTITQKNQTSTGGPLIIKFINGNLEISGDPTTGENNWNGSWKKH